MTSRRKNGRMTYLTGYAFAREKAKTKQQLEIIYRAIGPKRLTVDPALDKWKYHQDKVPFLGDWQRMRAKTYFYDNESVDSLKKITAERLDGLEAGRGAALIILDLIAKWMQYDDKLDDVFDGTPVLEGLSVAQQEKRSNRFYDLKEKNLKGVLKLIDKYLACHGIASESGMNDLGQLVIAVSNSAARNVLAGTAMGGALATGEDDDSGGNSPALNMISSAIAHKAKIFKMELPSAAVEGHVVQEEEKEEKEQPDDKVPA